MDDDIHMYEIVSYQGEGHKLNDGTKQTTCIDDKEELYMSLHDPSHEESSARYQVSCVQGGTGDIRTIVTNDEPEVKGSSECQVQKNELKQIKRCLCALSLLGVILFLMTIASLVLAAYAFYSTESSASKEIHQSRNLITILDTRISDTNESLVSLQNVVSMIESRINITSREVISLTATIYDLESQLNLEVVSQKAFITNLESRLNTTSAEVSIFVNILESRLNTINSEVTSQRTSINTLNSRLNGIDSEVSNLQSVRSSVTSLQSQLSTFLNTANISSLQIALRSQPRKYMQGIYKVPVLYSIGIQSILYSWC